MYEGEIEHIDHLAEHERGVVPDHSVEKAIDDVAERTGGYQRQAHENPGRRGSLAVHGRNPPHKRPEEQDAEQRQQELPGHAAELHSECHALVLHEADAEPFADDINLLTQLHIGLNQVFDNLVDDHQKDAEYDQLRASGNFHFLPAFASFSLASTVSVA